MFVQQHICASPAWPLGRKKMLRWRLNQGAYAGGAHTSWSTSTGPSATSWHSSLLRQKARIGHAHMRLRDWVAQTAPQCPKNAYTGTLFCALIQRAQTARCEGHISALGGGSARALSALEPCRNHVAMNAWLRHAPSWLASRVKKRT